jgi:hypothetical protein
MNAWMHKEIDREEIKREIYFRFDARIRSSDAVLRPPRIYHTHTHACACLKNVLHLVAIANR